MRNFYYRLALSAGLFLAGIFSAGAQTTTFERHFGTRNTLDEFQSVQPTTDGGLIALGTTANRSHGRTDMWLVKTNAAGDTAWTRTYGTSAAETGRSVQQTPDGGYLLAGQVYTPVTNKEDIYLVKTTASGAVQWQRTFGGTDVEICNSMALTADGGAVLVGYLSSYAQNTSIGTQLLVLKTDAAGNLVWQQTPTSVSPRGEKGHAIQQTTDGGYIVAAEGGYEEDAIAFKLTPTGGTTWRHGFGTGTSTTAVCVQQTADGGYVLGGMYEDLQTGQRTPRITKLNPAGNATYAYDVPGNHEYAREVRQTSDGGYIILADGQFNASAELSKVDANWQQQFLRVVPVGFAYQTIPTLRIAPNGDYLLGGYSTQYSIGYEGMLVRYSATGTLLWQRYYGTEGGTGMELGRDIAPTADGGGVVLSEEPTSTTDDQTRLRLTKLAATGITQWTTTINNTFAADLLATSIRPTPDGGFVVMAASYLPDPTTYIFKTTSQGVVQWSKEFPAANSPAVFGKTIPTADGGYAVITGFVDRAWLLKLNSAGDTVWTRQFGNAGITHAYDLVQTSDGGYAFAGRASTFGRQQQAWAVRTSATGQLLWSRTYGRAGTDRVSSIQQTTDGGFILGGYSDDPGTRLPQALLLKLSGTGDSTWARLLPPTTSFTFGYRALPTADGGYILLDLTNTDPLDSYSRSARLTKTDALGTTLWQRSFGSGTQPILYSLEASADGGFMSVGYQQTTQGDADVYVLKTDGSGNVLSAGQPATVLRPELTLYPNPARSHVRLQLPADMQTGALQLTLLDLLGRSVREWNVVAAPAELPLEMRGVARGTYVLRVSSPTNHLKLNRRLILE
ncbi:hypothetical protein KBK19_03100 [Microvirga sp. STR05]|uniref:T9SS type A sorting domain-containing protein n=1 Tax=Hymenobacter duratus TaxID=2771356 RepID=A0ABR8JEM7_9BACT|nr:hypothetical protein [Hymenobacter duratus]MBD2714016.1 hypothetical protein [Hymenobacter duratus]MBR7948918.1 hypothetical protein [Microvirga sp. STR05]